MQQRTLCFQLTGAEAAVSGNVPGGIVEGSAEVGWVTPGLSFHRPDFSGEEHIKETFWFRPKFSICQDVLVPAVCWPPSPGAPLILNTQAWQSM